MPQLEATVFVGAGLSVYTFAAGIVAVFRRDERLAETAAAPELPSLWRHCGSLALVFSAFRDDFSLAYIFTTAIGSPRAVQVRRALVRPGRLFASGAGCSQLRTGFASSPQVDTVLVAHASIIIRPSRFLPDLVTSPLIPSRWSRAPFRRRQWTQPAAAVSGDGDSSAMLYLGTWHDVR